MAPKQVAEHQAVSPVRYTREHVPCVGEHVSTTLPGCPAPSDAPLPRRTNNDPTARAFGAALRKGREDSGLTIETVAGRIKRAGRDGKPTTMDPKYLRSIEQGYHSPTITTAAQIAAAMGRPLSDLVTDL